MTAENEHLQAIASRRAEIDAAHDRATRTALLEHARMGRSVSTWQDGRVVWIPPAEIFARYGFDEFGRPLAATPENPAHPTQTSE